MSNNLTSEQLELLYLLRNELAEIIELDVDRLYSDVKEVRAELLRELSVRAENLSNAAKLIGLTGFSNSLFRIHTNLNFFSEKNELASDAEAELIQIWAIYCLSHLQAMDNGDTQSLAETIIALLDFLQISDWPQPVTDEERLRLEDQFSHSWVVADEEDSSEIPAEATDDIVTLHIPEDVRPELLEGLLLELPPQSQQFSKAINGYLHQADPEQLNVAQRIAHTIKGAANVVGVAGLANLMHYAEDLIEVVLKDDLTPPYQLSNFLVDVSDCLESIVEKLLGVGEGPDNFLELMQQLLDWDRYVLACGVPTEDEAAQLRFTSSKPAYIDPAMVSDDVSVGDLSVTQDDEVATEVVEEQAKTVQEQISSSVRVTDKTADDLLRIAGENIISNNLFHNRIESVKETIRQAQLLHQHVHKIADELELLVEIKSAFSRQQAEDGDIIMDPLELERYNELHSFSHQLQEVSTDAKESMLMALDQLENLHDLAVDQQQLNRENQDLVMSMRMEPVRTLASRLQRCVRQACRLTGKLANLEIVGEDILIDARVLSELIDPLMHLLRNSVDHGIETPKVRNELNKSEAGSLLLEFKREGEFITVVCSDDGRGLDLEKITETAMKNGVLEQQRKLTATEVQQLIFAPGFSTKDQASHISGRGIGLDVVMNQIKHLKGNIVAESDTGQGTKITMSLPITLISSHALLVKVGARVLSIVTRGVYQIVYLEDNDIRKVGEQMSFQRNDLILPAYYLKNFTSFKQAANADEQIENPHIMLVVTMTDGTQCGVIVDEIVASQDMVIKPFNRFTYRTAGVVGATILGDGSVSPIVDLAELIEAGVESGILNIESDQDNAIELDNLPEVKEDRPLAIVVDDSLSARRSLAQFVSDIGLDVKTAKDGFEAIEIIDKQVPSLMLVDLEMPRMNGLELTAHVRSRNTTRDVPVIMITSRTTEKHKNLASEAGVSTYLTKPFSEDELLQYIQEQIA